MAIPRRVWKRRRTSFFGQAGSSRRVAGHRCSLRCGALVQRGRFGFERQACGDLWLSGPGTTGPRRRLTAALRINDGDWSSARLRHKSDRWTLSFGSGGLTASTCRRPSLGTALWQHRGGQSGCMTLMHSLRADLQCGRYLGPSPSGRSCLANLLLLADLCHLS